MSIAEKLETIAENEQKVFDAGKKSQYDEFWDGIQRNGKRTDYYYAFSGYGWSASMFKPKYNLNPTNGRFSSAFFASLGLQNHSLIDLLNEAEVVLDTSKCYAVTDMFRNCPVTEIPHIDCSSVDTANRNVGFLFGGCSKLRKIEKLTLKEGVEYTSNTFSACSALEEIEFAGVLAKGLDLHWSTKLNKASITSLINILSPNVSGHTITLSLTAVKKAFETSVGANDGNTSAEWTSLIATKSNWTISLT